MGQHCSDCEQRAEAAERDLLKLKLLAYLSGRIGEEMDGVVTGVESFGLFVEGLELPAQGLIHADGLSDDYYLFDRATHSLTGRRGGKTYRLGDVVRVAVARVDLERRELDFRLISPKPAVRKGKEAKAPVSRGAASGNSQGRRPQGRNARAALSRGAATSTPSIPSAAIPRVEQERAQNRHGECAHLDSPG